MNVTMWAKLLKGATQLRITKEAKAASFAKPISWCFIVANESHLC